MTEEIECLNSVCKKTVEVTEELIASGKETVVKTKTEYAVSVPVPEEERSEK